MTAATHVQPVTRVVNGVLHDPWVSNDGVDVLLHGDIHTMLGKGPGAVSVITRVTIAIPEDDLPDLLTALDEERDQLRANGSAIDDHDRWRDENGDEHSGRQDDAPELEAV